MKISKKTILIKDEPKLLFFLGGLLTKLSQSGYDVYLDDITGYGDFLSHFPNLRPKGKKNNFDLILNLNNKNQSVNDDELNLAIEIDNSDFFCDSFFDLIESKFYTRDFEGKNVLITAGPTVEDIDPVRYLTNRSTGKMGVALARNAFIRGANVTLILGPGTVEVPPYLNLIKVRSAAEMHQAVLKEFEWCEFYFSSAAVADYTPAKKLGQKIKKGKGGLQLEMARTQDILQDIQNLKKAHQTVIGFSVETENLGENSLQKLLRKKLDMIVANNPGIKGAAFAGDTNQVEIITKTDHLTLPLLSKIDTAKKILDYLLAKLEK